MGFIRNFEIWNNQRPLVCSYDVLDYCTAGVIGNTCTSNTTPINTIDWEDSRGTADETSDAWLRAIYSWFLCLDSFYWEWGTDDPPSGGHPAIPTQFNSRCITPENYQRFLDLYYGEEGFLSKYKEWKIAKRKWWNCITNPIYKLTGVQNHSETLPSSNTTTYTWSYNIDYTDYQVATRSKYLEHRTTLDAMLAALKILMHIGGKQPLTHYDIVPQPCPDLNIGTQVWKRCNLSVSTYRNGDTIPQVTDPTEWSNLTTGAWCYYNNDPSTEPLYGKLYNWYAVNDPRGLAPLGYHIPTDAEWGLLVEFMGGDTIAGGKLKSTQEIGLSGGGCAGWTSPNLLAQHPHPDRSNARGFTALGGGYRIYDGDFYNEHDDGYWWTRSLYDNVSAVNYNMNHSSTGVGRSFADFVAGLSVRLVKGEIPPPCEVTIGTQTWQCENLNVATYRNGDVIPQVTDPTEWANLTTGAWCYYDNDPSTEATYGKLYNWHAVNDSRGIAPTGYHVPSDTELTTLTDYLGGDLVAGGKMKETGLSHWVAPNTAATNESGFTALPAGYRINNGTFESIGEVTRWWTSTEIDTFDAGSYDLDNTNPNLFRFSYGKKWGHSVRLIKD